ncbi:MFS transporter [Maritimibacter dapengensis]|uniref:MFS transporter n=1 Tax=Maritimibacter dapengensis TaxID=2836868 RepID=A0ABS6T013_9RHOB|nr:MFS transporter [Maritimibacter dapengensis]MBV7378580.1 MFS transporter [Maritimibacter dapengensis]
MPLIETLRLSRASAFVLMATGVYWGGLAGMMPDVKAQAGASDGEMGAVLLAPALASVIAMGVAPWASERFGGRVLPVATLLIAAAFLLYLTAFSVPSLAVALFLGGFAVAFADMTANVRLSHIEAERDVHLMNLNHAAYSISFGITALLIAVLRKDGWAVTQIAPLLGTMALAYAVLGWDAKGALAGEDDEGEVSARVWPVVTLAGLVLFCSFVIENATEAWSALHIERTLGAPTGEGSLGPALLGFVMGAGRLSGQALARRMGAERLILSSAVLAVIGGVVIAAAPTPGVVQIGVVLAGLGVAVTVPSTNSIIARKVRNRHRAHAISRAWMIGLLGFFVGPAMMGGLAELSSLRLSFFAVAVVALAIFPAVVALSRR